MPITFMMVYEMEIKMSQSKTMIEHIYFIWNADYNLSGAYVTFLDIIRNQHSCSLCEIAYHTVTEKQAWRDYKAALGIPVQEIYKNRLTAEQVTVAEQEYPVVLAQTGQALVKLLGKAEIDACAGNLDRFKEKLNAKLAGYAA